MMMESEPNFSGDQINSFWGLHVTHSPYIWHPLDEIHIGSFQDRILAMRLSKANDSVCQFTRFSKESLVFQGEKKRKRKGICFHFWSVPLPCRQDHQQVLQMVLLCNQLPLLGQDFAKLIGPWLASQGITVSAIFRNATFPTPPPHCAGGLSKMVDMETRRPGLPG